MLKFSPPLPPVPAPVCSEAPEVEGTRLVVRWTYRHTGGEAINSVGVYYTTTSDSSRHSLSDDPDAVLGGVELINRRDSILLPEAGLTYQFSVSASNDRGPSQMVDCPPLSLSVGGLVLSFFIQWNVKKFFELTILALSYLAHNLTVPSLLSLSPPPPPPPLPSPLRYTF